MVYLPRNALDANSIENTFYREHILLGTHSIETTTERSGC